MMARLVVLARPRDLLSRLRYPRRLTSVNCRFKTTLPPEEEIDLDKPIKFSTSRAATWRAQETFSGYPSDKNRPPWMQPYVVSLSLTVFLLYFCYFREENDIDNKFSRTLYDHIDGLEEKQLEICLKHYQETGQDTKAILERLAEIRDIKDKTVDKS
nr:uncharacterized protein LOC123755776 isoform X2 [Procambarus clarkii]